MLAVALTLGVAGVATAANVGPGEQRFNVGIYKASHNSYERGETTHSQIDSWNCWCIELDLHWNGFAIWVEHFCGDPSHEAQTLSTELAELAATIDAAERVTLVYLEMKGADPPCYWSWSDREEYRANITTQLEGHLGASRIYRSSEFRDTDLHRWPSYQELLRRGYRWIVVLDEEATGFADSDFFFGIGRGNPPIDSTDFEPNSVLINVARGSLVPDRSVEPDRWLFRAYPGIQCGGDDDDQGYFYGAIDKGYNFIATNCIDQSHTMHPETHSPSPVHVELSGAGLEYGTLPFPFQGATGLISAVARASPRVPIRIGAGDYDVPAGTRLDRRVVLEASGGLVRIR